jgi:fatty-acyl-CoA synthase
MFATAKIGAVLVTVNTAYKSHEVEYLLKQSNVKTLALIYSFQDVDYLRIIYDLLPELKNSERERLKSKYFPCLKSLIYIGQEKHRGMYNSNELMLLGSHYPNDELRKILASLNGDNIINMQYTSGTTGFPKGVMLTNKNILNNGLSIGERQKFTQND